MKDQWIKALRSGEYKQGKEAMNRGGCLCCLGVLCEIGGIPHGEETSDGIEYVFDAEHYDKALFPEDTWFYKTTGFYDDTMYFLAELNDAGLSFEQIADVIEKGDLDCMTGRKGKDVCVYFTDGKSWEYLVQEDGTYELHRDVHK